MQVRGTQTFRQPCPAFTLYWNTAHECLPSRQQHSHHLIIYSSSGITLSTHTYTGKVSKYSFVLTLSHSNTVLLSALEVIGWYKLMCHFSSVPCNLMRVGGEGFWGGVALTCAFQSNLRPLCKAPVHCSFLPNVCLCSRPYPVFIQPSNKSVHTFNHLSPHF